MQLTTNYKLKKPEGSDVVNVQDFNDNADILDNALATHKHTKSQITDMPSALKNPNALTIQLNGSSQGAYDGSSAKTINITKSSIGLSNVDNVSKAQILASPALTGVPTAPTATAGTNTTQIATTAFVTTAVNNKTSVSGNAGTATKLQTARTINGVAFDGSQNITTPTISTGGNITLHADSDSSTTTEYASIKAGGNELKITSSGGGSSPAKNNNNLTFNGNIVYHAGKKPTPADIGASATGHTHDDRYYTESEINSKINTINNNINGKANSNHNHDDRYYTESEINSKLNDKVNGKNRIITYSNLSVLGLTFPVTCETLANAMRNGDVLFCDSCIISDAPTEYGHLFVMREDDNRIEFQYRNCGNDANKNTINELYIASYRRLSEGKKFSGWTLIGGDSGWIKLPLNSGIRAYNSYEIPQYRKCANVVNLVGTIYGATGMNSYDWVTIGTLPVGYRPPFAIYTVCHGSGVGKWLMRILADGVVEAGRYTENGSSVKSSMDKTEWLTLSATFLIR